MARTLSSPITQVIRRLAERHSGSPASDQQLLERFLDQKDQTAFRALLRRHGSMVFNVCRCVLGNDADAEDAFQSTFLVLALKGASIRKASSVASWLHGVAYRTALKARRRSSSRRKNEALTPLRQFAAPDDLSWREVRQVLHEELATLPERYRLPLVLCYLEGHTQDQAAKKIGIAESTLKQRLERARSRLRLRLVRRGLGPAAVLAAAAWPAAETSAGVPLQLVSSTVQAAALSAAKQTTAGIISVEVASLTRSVVKTMLLTKLQSAAAMVLAALVIAAGAAELSVSPLAGRPLPIQQLEPASQTSVHAGNSGSKPFLKNVPPSKATVLVRGEVLDPNGRPFAHARLYLGSATRQGTNYSVRATSGEDGRFRFSVPEAELDNADADNPPQVMAVAEGMGCDWATVSPAGQDVTLRLVKDFAITPRILDLEGKPVPGARLTVINISAPQREGLDLATQAKANWNWAGPLPGQSATFTTDRNGRIDFRGTGADRVVLFKLEGARIATQGVSVMAAAAAKKDPRGRTVAYGAGSDVVANASRAIRGVVRDQQTGKPLAGVVVGRPGTDWVRTTTDRDGRYELRGCDKGSQYSLLATPADGLHFARGLVLEDRRGLEALTCDIELVRGLTVRGRVTDAETGLPIVGARVDYHPFQGNESVNRLLPGTWDPSSQTTTGADGSYTNTVMPGPGLIGVKAPRLDAYVRSEVRLADCKRFFKHALIEARDDEDFLPITAGGGSGGALSPIFYNALVLLEPGEHGAQPDQNVALQKPRERKGRVVGPDGRPLAGARVYGLVPFGVETLKGDEFDIRGINPKARRPLVFCHKEKNLGFYMDDLRSQGSGLLTVKLQPCGSVSGRLVGDGKPVPGFAVYVIGNALRIFGEAGGGYHRVTTDKEGRFRVEGLVAGQQYWVREISDRPSFPRFLKSVVVECGKRKDLGDITLEPAAK
jgi:RNA polymerase sigma factor (sigma-70 family)